MKRLWAVAGLSAALTALAPMTAEAATFSFTGPLSGLQEVPPVSSNATGSFEAILNGDPDNWTFNYKVIFADLAGELILAHIHRENRGVNGPVVHNLDNAPVNQGVTSGTIMGDWTSTELPAGVAAADVFNRFLANGYYFNLHSTVFRGGELRGQIENPVPVGTPEPASLMGLALVSSAVLLLRRKQQVMN
jgi:CHRD domain